MSEQIKETKTETASAVDALVSVREALEAECERFKVLKGEAATEIAEAFYEGMVQGLHNAIVHLIHDEVQFPEDLDDFMNTMLYEENWVFHQGQWKKDGWRSRSTEELYNEYH